MELGRHGNPKAWMRLITVVFSQWLLRATSLFRRHPREGGDPVPMVETAWIPAFAGMTTKWATNVFIIRSASAQKVRC